LRLRSDASQLIALSQEVIVSVTSTTTRALLDATDGIPIVAAVSGDPIALGFTKSLAQPTGNVTGFTTFNDTLAAMELACDDGETPIGKGVPSADRDIECKDESRDQSGLSADHAARDSWARLQHRSGDRD
jgi:hypothetical protein